MANDVEEQDPVELSMALPKELHFYFNGLAVTIGAADVTIVLREHRKPLAVLHASHITAKTLVKLLSGVIETYEKNVGQEILTVQDVAERLERLERSQG